MPWQAMQAVRTVMLGTTARTMALAGAQHAQRESIQAWWGHPQRAHAKTAQEADIPRPLQWTLLLGAICVLRVASLQWMQHRPAQCAQSVSEACTALQELHCVVRASQDISMTKHHKLLVWRVSLGSIKSTKCRSLVHHAWQGCLQMKAE